jgi:prepilin-type N-terminal cleavage/methylation domain-containing protein
MKNNKKLIKKRGFTLIELLISVGLFTAVSTIIMSILFTSIRANRKSEVIVNVKQIGNNAMTQMVNGIRFARSLDDPIDCTTTVIKDAITVTGIDYGQTDYSCPAVSGDTISSNSASLVDSNVVAVSECSFSCSQASLSDAPTITIQFILNPVSQTELTETTGYVPFKTSVTLRNFSR